MAKQSDTIQAIAQTPDDRILLTQIAERADLCRERCYLTSTRFLDLREADMAQQLLHTMGWTNGRVWGGYDGAERQVLSFLPDWMDADTWADSEDNPLAAVRCSRHREDVLTHRDYLGSLMGLGLRRDCIGDILVGEHGVDIVVLREIVPFLLTHYEKAGRKRLTVAEIPLSALIVPEEAVNFVRDTVASMRLDAIVASMFRLPRTRAADAVKAGKVFLNQRQCFRPDHEIAVHDRITLRGTGRGEVDEVLGESRKGRVVVSLKRFG